MNNVKYEYSQYSDYNRFSNLDGIEGKIIEHLVESKSKFANLFWKVLKYDSKDALSLPELTAAEKWNLVDGTAPNPTGGQTANSRVFFSRFVDDMWVKEASFVSIFVNDISPTDASRSYVSIGVDTAVHAKINTIYGDADEIANPEGTNPNDYYYTDSENPVVKYKSRVTVLLKCILAELNGLYIDGVGYLQFLQETPADAKVTKGQATFTQFDNRAFAGHKIRFNVVMSGVSESADYGF